MFKQRAEKSLYLGYGGSWPICNRPTRDFNAPEDTRSSGSKATSFEYSKSLVHFNFYHIIQAT